jgi:hypothetical protein
MKGFVGKKTLLKRFWLSVRDSLLFAAKQDSTPAILSYLSEGMMSQEIISKETLTVCQLIAFCSPTLYSYTKRKGYYSLRLV